MVLEIALPDTRYLFDFAIIENSDANSLSADGRIVVLRDGRAALHVLLWITGRSQRDGGHRGLRETPLHYRGIGRIG